LLAVLEHDHIVKVYSAFTDVATGMHGLCLQYVPGADLGVVIRRMFASGCVPGSGQSLLEALDAARRGAPVFDPAALRDREALAGDDFAQAVCRIGGRLAEALAFAHARGILHCDIKPGNILLTPYGRPMLADFNVAFDRTRHNAEDTHFGGTLAYMAPEYRGAMFGMPGGSVDERCDIYSLGVVLHELATGKRPDPLLLTQSASTADPTAQQPELKPGAQGEADSLAAVPRELGAVIRRCLEPDPAKRYQTATDLAAALSGAWHLLAARRALPPPSRIGRRVTARPALALALAGILPHLAASVAQIGYNAVEVKLGDAQQYVFTILVIATT
jgi:serine/threonine protein kinase